MCGVFRVSCSLVLLVVSLLVVVLVSSLFVGIFMTGANGASLENAIHVKNEAELKNAINSASSKGIVIALNNDITLTNDPLIISANKDITLTSNKPNDFYKLIGANGANTITVEGNGVLRLDGVIVTHANGAEGRGVYVMDNDGQFIMYNGEVSGNIITYNTYVWPRDGGGVFSRGVFELHGGKISNNQAEGLGGGMHNMDGTFKMFGGEISNNRVIDYYTDNAIRYSIGNGGGVYNGGVFELYGGKISNNQADGDGGGVYVHMHFDSALYGVFRMFGGIISGNTAGQKGGGVYSVQGGLLQGGTISGNNAGQKGGGVYWHNGIFDDWAVVISGNTAKDSGNDVYSIYGSSEGNGGGSSGGNDGSSNGSGGSGGNGSGGGFWSGGSGGSSSGGVGFGLRDVVFVCVGVAVVVVGVVVAVLLFTFKKELNVQKARQTEVECICDGGC